MQSSFIKTISILCLITLVWSCFDKPLSISKTPIADLKENDASLKMDGYYLSQKKSNRFICDWRGIILHKNGILQIGGGTSGSQVLENDKYVLNITKADPNDKLGWGVYKIKGDDIKIQFWASPSGGGYAAPIIEGKVLNDTKFTLRYSTFTDTFHFRQYSPKPDSTNQFIK